MKQYPLPNKYRFLKHQNSGGFLENRNDRIHCGVDLYAPRKTPVYAVDDGIILFISEFTSSEQIEYWNTTYSLILFDESMYYYRFAELETIFVKRYQRVRSGDQIGLVGQVINPIKINETHPTYIHQLCNSDKFSMLHFEMYDCQPEQSPHYLGGNWFSNGVPKGLIDPTPFLDSV